MGVICFAVCGFGRVGKRHAKIIDQDEDTKLCSIVDIKERVREEALSLGYNVDIFENLEAFIQSDNGVADVVTIAVPNGFHASLALRALDAGYHVVIEKPMALTKSECEKIIFKSLEVNKRVFVVKQNRYSPTSIWLKNIVTEGILGDIYMVQTNCYWNRDERYYKPDDWHGTLEMDGGTLYTQFSHFIDILYWVFGDIQITKTQLENFSHDGMIEFEDSGFVQFDFKNGGMGNISYSTSCWGQNMESSITVIGSNGGVKVGGQYMNKVEYCHIKDYKMPELAKTNPPNDYGPYKGSAANHHFVFENVVKTLNGEEAISTNALEGMKVVEIIENIYT